MGCTSQLESAPSTIRRLSAEVAPLPGATLADGSVLFAMPYLPFDYSLDYARLDLRRHPELYRVGQGEQGVLLVEPYKSEILPHWTFKAPAAAKRSSAAIYRLFLT